jgi:hypothetical protein
MNILKFSKSRHFFWLRDLFSLESIKASSTRRRVCNILSRLERCIYDTAMLPNFTLCKAHQPSSLAWDNEYLIREGSSLSGQYMQPGYPLLHCYWYSGTSIKPNNRVKIIISPRQCNESWYQRATAHGSGNKNQLILTGWKLITWQSPYRGTPPCLDAIMDGVCL